MYLASPTESDTTLLPYQEEEKVPPCPRTAQPMEDHRDSANEESLNFQHFPPMEFLITTALPKSTKEDSSPLFPWTYIVQHEAKCPELPFFIVPE